MDHVAMETSVDADLARHPLRLNDTPLARGDATPARDDAGPAHWGESEGEESFGFSGCDEDDIPCTQELDPRPLAGLIVFVDVRSGTGSCENRSKAIEQQLEALGASTCPRFTKDVTHVVFKDGRPSTREKAEKKDVYLVSPLWVEACKRAGDRVSEPKYPVLSREGSDTPVVLGRIKRIKSMQPKPLEEEIARSLERGRKRQITDVEEAGGSSRKKPFVLASDPTPTGDETLDLEHSAESAQDSFELPTIVLPSTPRMPGAAVTTPVTVSLQRIPASASTKQLSTGTPGTSTGIGTGTPGTRQPSIGTGTPGTRQPSIGTGTPGTRQPGTTSIPPPVEEGEEGGEDEEVTVRATKKKAASGKRAAVKGKKAAKPRVPLKTVVSNKDHRGRRSRAAPSQGKRKAVKSSKSGGLSTGKENARVGRGKVAKGSKLKSVLKSPKVKSEVAAEGSEVKGESSSAQKKRVRFRESSRSRFERQRPTLVLTSMTPKDQEVVLSIVDKLGGFEVANTVSDSTSHVVCGSPRRTINALAATAKGCWVLSPDWVWKSLEAGRWMKEEPYEMADDFPAAQFFRLERQGAGLLYRPSLFAKTGSVFIASDSTPPSQQLELLMTLGGAKVSRSHRKADVCIGCKAWREEVQSVSEQWVLDSITEHQLLPLEDYLLQSPHSTVASPEL